MSKYYIKIMIIFNITMMIIKLNATESTNTFLKEMCHNNEVENYTVVYSENQSKGRGQMNFKWDSESGKNLTLSILVKYSSLGISKQFYISKVISLAIYEVVNSLVKVSVAIKWPNDILTASKKVCGVLIENSVKRSEIQHSIVGIGLNVNQELFVNLPNATSLKMITDQEYDLDLLLKKLIDSIKLYCKLIEENKFDSIDEQYLKCLYKYEKPSMYRDVLKDRQFLGKIVGTSGDGKLRVELENENIKEFNLKEIEFLN
jgi:BirA family biotin operon repressor/biotin-[acetyl-CoA-carboxylase] ligase